MRAVTPSHGFYLLRNGRRVATIKRGVISGRQLAQLIDVCGGRGEWRLTTPPKPSRRVVVIE